MGYIVFRVALLTMSDSPNPKVCPTIDSCSPPSSTLKLPSPVWCILIRNSSLLDYKTPFHPLQFLCQCKNPCCPILRGIKRGFSLILLFHSLYPNINSFNLWLSNSLVTMTLTVEVALLFNCCTSCHETPNASSSSMNLHLHLIAYGYLGFGL